MALRRVYASILRSQRRLTPEPERPGRNINDLVVVPLLQSFRQKQDEPKLWSEAVEKEALALDLLSRNAFSTKYALKQKPSVLPSDNPAYLFLSTKIQQEGLPKVTMTEAVMDAVQKYFNPPPPPTAEDAEKARQYVREGSTKKQPDQK